MKRSKFNLLEELFLVYKMRADSHQGSEEFDYYHRRAAEVEDKLQELGFDVTKVMEPWFDV